MVGLVRPADAPMGTRETYQGTLVAASKVVGGETLLADRLGVGVEQTVSWMLGVDQMPTEIFLRGVDIVLRESEQKVFDNRRFLEEIKRRAAERRAKENK